MSPGKVVVGEKGSVPAWQRAPTNDRVLPCSVEELSGQDTATATCGRHQHMRAAEAQETPAKPGNRQGFLEKVTVLIWVLEYVEEISRQMSERRALQKQGGLYANMAEGKEPGVNCSSCLENRSEGWTRKGCWQLNEIKGAGVCS